MGGHFISLSHWHSGDPPTTLDLDTEIFEENICFSCIFGNEKFQKINSDLGQDYYT